MSQEADFSALERGSIAASSGERMGEIQSPISSTVPRDSGAIERMVVSLLSSQTRLIFANTVSASPYCERDFPALRRLNLAALATRIECTEFQILEWLLRFKEDTTPQLLLKPVLGKYGITVDYSGLDWSTGRGNGDLIMELAKSHLRAYLYIDLEAQSAQIPTSL
jgi:hypothetical protein